MNNCIICRRFSQDKTVLIDNTINDIQINNILDDLNFKFPYDEYEYISNTICMECYYNLQELYTFREYCCGLLFEHAGRSTDNYCQICCVDTKHSEIVATTTYINGDLFKNADILTEICSYNLSVQPSNNLCKKCYYDLIRVYGFHLKCIDSLNYWTNQVLEVSSDHDTDSSSISSKTDSNSSNIKLKGNFDYKLGGNLRTLTGEKPFNCEICLKSFKTSSTLKIHLRIHTGERPYKCTECSKSYIDSSSLTKHFKIKHANKMKPYKCKECLKLFECSSKLQTHLKTHTGEKPFRCNICLKSFRQHANLKTHLKVHTGEKPQCKTCLKTFQNNYNLKRHLRIHLDKKNTPNPRPHKCSICLKSFTQSTTLKHHLNRHAGIKPYKCNICDRSFTEVGDLRKHFRIHTGERPYKCEICRKSFRHNKQLKRHLEDHLDEWSFD